MAYRFFPLYNLGSAVGKNAPNLTDDVKLVQALFEALFQDMRYYNFFVARSQKLGLRLQSVPRVTGQFNDDLQTVICAFQSIFPNWPQDGKIDPLPSAGGVLFDVHTRGKKQYLLFILLKTVLYMNAPTYMKIGKKIGISYTAKLDGEDIIHPS